MTIDELEKVTNSAAHIAQVAALLIGGIWAYFKFFRGRTFKRRLDLLVEASLHRLSGDDAIRATVRLHNIGLAKVNLAKGISVLAVYWCPSGIWPIEHARWPKLQVSPLFPDQDAIESGEEIVEELVVALTPDPNAGFVLAYDVRIEVWSANDSIVGVDKQSVRRDAATKVGARRMGLQIWSANVVIPVELQQYGVALRNEPRD